MQMTAIPPSSSQPPQSLQPAPQAVMASVPHPPPAFLKLALGTSLEGLVLTHSGRLSALVRTSLGILDLRTPLPLTAGSVLTIVVKALDPAVQVLISAVGRPPQDAGAHSENAATRSPDHALPGPRSDLPAALRGVHGLEIGTRLTARLERPGSWVSGSSAQLLLSSGFGPLGAGGSSMPFGESHLTLRIIAVQPVKVDTRADDSPSFEPMAPAAGRILRGISVGATPIGQPILRTVGGFLTLSKLAVVPQGTVLTLEIIGVSRTPLNTPIGVSPPIQVLPAKGELIPYRWSALTDTMATLNDLNSVAVRQWIQSFVPRSDSRIVTTILHYLQSLRGGDVRVWIGDKVWRELEGIGPDLAARLADDFRQLSRAADQPVSKDWRITQVPFFNGFEFEFIHLWIRHYDDRGEVATLQRRDQRFVVDVVLSRLGRMQLDGLVRDVGKRFDLIIRSESSLPANMRHHIRVLFANTSAITGLTGGIGFQTNPPDFVDVIPEPSLRSDSDIVV